LRERKGVNLGEREEIIYLSMKGKIMKNEKKRVRSL